MLYPEERANLSLYGIWPPAQYDRSSAWLFRGARLPAAGHDRASEAQSAQLCRRSVYGPLIRSQVWYHHHAAPSRHVLKREGRGNLSGGLAAANVVNGTVLRYGAV